MADLVKSLLGLIVRVGLLLAGLVFFAGLLAVGMLLLLLWLLRAFWARMTGQPVLPWAFQFKRRPPWQQQPAQADDVVDVQATDVTVVTDVEVKRIEPRR